MDFSPATRLLVVSPHPDDEILGAGGLIQRVLHAGGSVQVVYMTSGDGFPEGVAVIYRSQHPNFQDYRAYGTLREAEAKQALAMLGVPSQAVRFLGFPDGGLCPLQTTYPLDNGRNYRSPFTLEDRPPTTHAVLHSTEYNGEDLTKELVWVLQQFRPTLVVTTHPRDQHPDHCATYRFVRETLRALPTHDAALRPPLFTFLVHFGGWPLVSQESPELPLHLPQQFPESEDAWLPVSLYSAEIQAKRQALLQYHSQMLVMGQFLLSFIRTNELFSPESQDIQEVFQQLPCCPQERQLTSTGRP
jgi:LmbE family N-acetylglucosaminyl deacetylase